MSNLEFYAREQISAILPKFDHLELRATVSDSSYAIEFFVQINGERKQCYALADDGVVDEEALDQVLGRIANYIRNDADYKKGSINKIAF